MLVDVWLKTQNTFLGVYMRDEFSLPGMHRPRLSREYVLPDLIEGLVEIGLGWSVSVSVNDLNRVRVAYGDVIRSESYKWA